MGRVAHVEVARKASTTQRSKVEALVKSMLMSDKSVVTSPNFSGQTFLNQHTSLASHVDSIRVYVESSLPPGVQNGKLPKDSDKDDVDVILHVYPLNRDEGEAEYMNDDDEGDAAAAWHSWLLPSYNFDGLWDSLIFEDDVKTRLMKYIYSAVLFAEKGVDPNLVSCNKVVLLHGPPGTGKTSLCKALAQKATIRLSSRYKYGQLIEINSHSLFSKWFSESGKLVMQMFEKVQDYVSDPQCLVFLLIDEVESLAQNRQSVEARNEPTDSIRAVNALLTQIDKIKQYPNVIILTTSNMANTIDLAFVDRADLKIFIGPPSATVIYGILASSINELIRVGIVEASQNFPATFEVSTDQPQLNPIPEASRLLEIATYATQCGLSGRGLRKLPFLAHSNFLDSMQCDIRSFLEALRKTVAYEKKEVASLRNNCI